MRVLVTGAAGFIGAALSKRLVARGDEVCGFDNINDYYDVRLKEARLALLTPHANFRFVKGGLQDRDAVDRVFADFKPQRVVNLAAQAGVRYSRENPRAYVDSNLVGANRKLPFSVRDAVDHPVSLYAATKKANELMAHTYSHLYGLPTTGLRFFTVYGPWGRPDMSPMLFARKIFAGEPIEVFNHGRHSRDFTYIDDVVEGVLRTLDHVPVGDPSFDAMAPTPGSSSAPYRVYNIGNHVPVELARYIEIFEQCIGRKAEKILLPLQPGDVPDTYADVEELTRAIDYSPSTSIEAGIAKFIDWYRDYYRV